MAGSMTAGRETGMEQQETEEDTGMRIFDTSKPTPTDVSPPTRPHQLIFPNSFINLRPNIQTYKSLGIILIQTTKMGPCELRESNVISV